MQTEARKTYKALLDTDEFTGFDLSHEYVFNDVVYNLDVYIPLYQPQDGAVLIVPCKVYVL